MALLNLSGRTHVEIDDETGALTIWKDSAVGRPVEIALSEEAEQALFALVAERGERKG